MKVLGIDIGTQMGWVLYDSTSDRILGIGAIDLSPKRWEGAGMRPFMMRQFIKKAFTEMEPDVVCYENVNRHRGVIAAHVFGELRGVLLEECEIAEPKMPVTAIRVTEWKKASIGRGNAAKDDVLLWAQKRDDFPNLLTSFDAADALGIAYGFSELQLGG